MLFLLRYFSSISHPPPSHLLHLILPPSRPINLHLSFSILFSLSYPLLPSPFCPPITLATTSSLSSFYLLLTLVPLSPPLLFPFLLPLSIVKHFFPTTILAFDPEQPLSQTPHHPYINPIFSSPFSLIPNPFPYTVCPSSHPSPPLTSHPPLTPFQAHAAYKERHYPVGRKMLLAGTRRQCPPRCRRGRRRAAGVAAVPCLIGRG